MLLEIMIMHEMMMKLQNFGADWILQLSDLRQIEIPVKFPVQNQNINKNSSADWSVWNLRVKTIKTKDKFPQAKSTYLNFNIIV